MDPLFEAKIQNIISEINNQLEKEYIDESVARTLMSFSVNRINLLMTHIGFIESKLESTLESNKMMAIHVDNLIAENQRLNQIVNY